MIKSGPLVSVVLCTFNGAAHLEEQLDSLCHQDYENIEIIISDDASTDGTQAILEAYSLRDRRIKFSVNKNNLGYNRNFQKAILQSTGKYIAISDQDDVWDHAKIRIMVERFSGDDETVMVHCLSAHFRTGEPADIDSLKNRRCFSGNDVRKLFLYNQISGHNMLLKRSLVEKAIPFPSTVYYDWWLAVTACCYGKISCVEKVLVHHRRHEGNVTVLEKQKPFYMQVLRILPLFLDIPAISPAAKSFGLHLLRGFNELQMKKFSFPLFAFIFRHARILFSFRRYRFPYPSYFKRSLRLASADFVSKP